MIMIKEQMKVLRVSRSAYQLPLLLHQKQSTNLLVSIFPEGYQGVLVMFFQHLRKIGTLFSFKCNRLWVLFHEVKVTIDFIVVPFIIEPCTVHSLLWHSHREL